MSDIVRLPLESCPQVVHAWRSVHVGPETQTFVVDELWGMHLYRYAADVWMDGRPLRVGPGWAGFTPPGAEMRYRFEGVCAHVFAHFRWPQTGSLVELPFVFSAGPRFESLWERLEEAIPWRGTQRGDVRAWDVALELAESALAPPEPVHEAVAAALAFIEARLADSISADQVAEVAFVSHNHLCRLFRTHLGDTVMGTIRKRRVERARHLLVHTTLPVKEIAAQVGIDDLQRFNKTMRLETGHSPRELRSRAEGFELPLTASANALQKPKRDVWR